MITARDNQRYLDSPGFATQTTVAGLCMRPLRPMRLLHHHDRLGKGEFMDHG